MTVQVDLEDKKNVGAVAELEDGEFIEKHVLPISQLHDTLTSMFKKVA